MSLPNNVKAEVIEVTDSTIVEDTRPDENLAETTELSDIIDRLDCIVPQFDNPATSALTFRSILLGTLWATVLSFANSILSFRTNAFTISAQVAVILSYPMGLGMAAWLPSGIMNPGPFTMKEHVLIFIMASSSGQPYGIENVVSQAMPRLMNNSDISFGQAFAFVLVTQFTGYGLSGLTRRFLVKPTAMWWPGNLSTIAIFTSFHNEDAVYNSRIKITRFRMFCLCFAAMFFYTWIPEFFMPVLQSVSTICLFNGNTQGKSSTAGVMGSVNSVLGSTTNGLGILGTTFDWIYVGSAYITSPAWAVACNIGGSVILQYIIAPLLYFADAFGDNSLFSEDPYNHNPIVNTGHLFVGNPNSSTHALGSRVKPTFFYNTLDNYNLNLTAYEDVQPVRITSFFLLSYAGSFLAISAALSHVIMWYGPTIRRQIMNAFKQENDEVDSQDKHVKMMEAYPEIPDWAYLVFLAICAAGAVIISECTPFAMPWWGVFFNLLLVVLFVLPFGIIQAISGFNLGLNVLTEFLIGLMIPGRTVAVMAFKSWGTNNIAQSLALSQDLKLGQYLHIAPVSMVFAQFWGTLINCLCATAASWWMMFSSGNLLDGPEWQYIGYQVFYSAGGIWGAIGPQRFFGIGSLYQSLLLCFIIGLLLPVLPWIGNKYVVRSKTWKLINFPLMFTFVGPQVGFQNSFVVPGLVSYLSSVILFNHKKDFFQKYAYVIGAAFDSSAAIVVVIISIMGVAGITWSWKTLWNPNTDIWPYAVDYYCWPGRSYNDFGCEWYSARGLNSTSTGVSCV
ncbi:hypothetical protein HDU84_009871 [Entophlyctis sp. JEL0112]|nr:hypothetical protein HDU84_009871 [Entophlyctis sp. JEL0112]